MTCKKIAPWILLKLKKLFIETVQQDARNIFYMPDFLFRSNCRLYFFTGIFYLRLHFPVFLTNLYAKSYNDKKNLFNLGFSEPWMVAIVINKKNWHLTVDFGAYTVWEKWKYGCFEKLRKIVTEPYLRLALYLEEKNEIDQKKFSIQQSMEISWSL